MLPCQTLYDQRLAVIRDYAAYRAQELQWCQLKQQRHQTLARRQHQDGVWRQERMRLRQALSEVPIVTDWRAVLVVTDNCTRVCYGLPLFESGPHVTTEQVVAQLRTTLPPVVQFVVSDRGTHFTAHAFAQFAQDTGFIHVPIARHRPETNGIAERCVRTLKEWLLQFAWQSDQDLVGPIRSNETLAQMVEQIEAASHNVADRLVRQVTGSVRALLERIGSTGPGRSVVPVLRDVQRAAPSGPRHPGPLAQ